jgi:hypothetical protein
MMLNKTSRNIIAQPKKWLTALLTGFLLLQANPGFSAYCSLRDPLVAIQTLYPDATQHRSIVRPVDEKVRTIVAERLPFTLHFNEIGKHTLYLVMNDSDEIG